MTELFQVYLRLTPLNTLGTLASACALIATLYYTRKITSKLRYVTAAVLYVIFNWVVWSILYIFLLVFTPSAVGFDSNLGTDFGWFGFIIQALEQHFLEQHFFALVFGGWVLPIALVWWERRNSNLSNSVASQ